MIRAAMNRARWLALAILALLSGIAAVLLLRGPARPDRPKEFPAAAELELTIVAPAGGPAGLATA